MNNPSVLSLPRLAAALALTVSVASAVGITNRITNYSYLTNPATVKSGYSHYVDWSANPGAGHSTYSSMLWNGSWAKYFEYTSYAFSGSTPRCFTLATTGTVPASTTADTEIIIKNSAGVWVKLAGDVRGTYAVANFLFMNGGNTRSNPKIRVIAKSGNNNNEAFMFENTWFTDNQGACLDGIAALPGSLTPAAAIIDYNGTASIYRAK